MLIEIFYNSYFYDMELLIESRDAGETKQHAQSYMQKSEMSKFKGSRRLLTHLEHGDYTFMVIAKLPGVSHDTSGFIAPCFEFQLYSVTSETLKNRVMIANSLNLLGALGVKGSNFGQMLTVIPVVNLLP